MNELTIALRHWLGKHDITREGVAVTISFPNELAMFRAQQAIRHEIEAMAMTTGVQDIDRISTMNGIGLTLVARHRMGE